MDEMWHIELLGWLRAASRDRVVTRFRTHKTGALLAYLAFYGRRSHPREELVELLWPECEPRTGRNRLKTALCSLRRQLEPAAAWEDVPAGVVLLADRASVQLNPAACVTDVAEFEAALQAAARARSDTERRQRLSEAAALYRGELLPGYFEVWVFPERQRLADLFLQALKEWVARLEQQGELEQAVQWARLALSVDPLEEEAHDDLIRLLAAAGRPEAAQQQERERQRLLGDRDDAAPAPGASVRADPFPPAGPGQSERPLDRGLEADSSLPLVPAREPPQPEPFVSGRLPLRFDRFFGREAEIEQLCELLSPRNEERGMSNEKGPAGPRCSFLIPCPSRLVTLTGPPGSGKTRLALEVADRLRGPLQGAVWFVPLADLLDPGPIIDKIHGAMRLKRSPEIEPLEQITAMISRQPSLLLLDNFEHLVAEGAPRVQTLLERIPTLTCLVTSRRRLGLPGEQEFPVGPLPIPVESGEGRVENPAKVGQSDLSTLNAQLSTVAGCPSVALFVNRAQAVRPDFQLTRANATAVARLCAGLEGLPLAIELAAARAGVLTPAQMLERLLERFDLLASRQRLADPRHQSLRGALDWSFRLLPPELQRFFARLSVFRGGWTLAAAEAICGDPDHPKGGSPLDYLEQLRDGSLVMTGEVPDNREPMEPGPPGSGEAEAGRRESDPQRITARSAGIPVPDPPRTSTEIRFFMLESVREYAAEQLDPAERQGLARRHAEFFLAPAEEWNARLWSSDRRTYAHLLEPEVDNWRAALTWSLSETGDIDLALRLAGLLTGLWASLDRLDEARQWLEKALSPTTTPKPTKDRARALDALGYVLVGQGHSAVAQRPLEEAEIILRELANESLLAATLTTQAWAQVDLGGHATARALAEEARALFEAHGFRRGVARSLDCLGALAQRQGEIAAAEAFFAESAAISREVGDRDALGWALSNLGGLAELRGDTGRAQAIYEEGLATFRAIGDRRGVAAALGNLGGNALDRGDAEAARSLFSESLAMWRALDDRRHTADLLGDLGKVALYQEEYETAHSHFSESLAICREIQDRRGAADALNALGEVLRRQGALVPARSYAEESLAIQRELGDRSRIARALCTLGRIACSEGSPEAGRTRLLESLAIRQALGDKRGMAECLDGLAGVSLAQGQEDEAVRLLGAAEAALSSQGAVPPPYRQREKRQRLADLQTALGEATFARAWEAAQDLPWEQTVSALLTAPDPCGRESVHPIDPPAESDCSDARDPDAHGDLSPEEWEGIVPLLPLSPRSRGRPYKDHRRVINGILWKLRTGAPWRDVPARYGSWHTCHDRYRRWRRQGLWERIEQALRRPPGPAGEKAGEERAASPH